MTLKAVEAGIRDLHKVIHELVEKVTSLEAKVTDQNEIITKQVQATSAVSCCRQHCVELERCSGYQETNHSKREGETINRRRYCIA